MIWVKSIQIGLPRELGDRASSDPFDRPWRSGFFKRPASGPVTVAPETIVGEGVADRVNHGGPDKAILAYAAAHYPAWQAELGVPVPPGAFGENLTIEGQTEADVCVGDVYSVGDGGVVLEVSQPRQPCWKLGRRWRRADLPHLVIGNGLTGWYFRVRTVGTLAAGGAVKLLDRPLNAPSVADLNDMLYGRRPVARAACECPALAPGWRAQLCHRLDRPARVLG